MKVVYFSYDYTPHDHRFLSALADSGHAVYYLRLQRGERQYEDRPVPPAIQQVRWAGGQVPFTFRALPRLVPAFRAALRRIQPDLVHAGPIQTCGLIATLASIRPRLIMSWGFDLMQDCDRNALWRWATRFVLRRADYFTSDCQVTRQRAVSFGADPDRTAVFPWGVDLGHFSPGSRRSPGVFTLFCSRSWEPQYGVDVLARAFALAARQRPDLQLLLLGGGSQAGSLREIFERSGLTGRVVLAGRIAYKDLPRFYHQADLYISPSHVDGSSVSLMEAMACGLPCLVSDIPANREWIAEGENGWLFQDGNVEALAERILQLAERRDLGRIGQAARRTAEAKADWPSNFSVLLSAYQQMVGVHA